MAGKFKNRADTVEGVSEIQKDSEDENEVCCCAKKQRFLAEQVVQKTEVLAQEETVQKCEEVQLRKEELTKDELDFSKRETVQIAKIEAQNFVR